MSSTPAYAATPLIGQGSTVTADTSYTQPTETTVGVIAVATSLGARIDQLMMQTQGTSVAGLLRLWTRLGTMGAAIATITFVGTTATVTTTGSHGMSTGMRINVLGAFPYDYNAKNVAITVTGLTTFTYTMATTPTVNAIGVGTYSYAPAAPSYSLIKEIPIQAITGSATAPGYTNSFNSTLNQDWLPIALAAGSCLCSTVTVTQTNALMTTAFGGQA